jgi:hypothetical protein
MKRLIAPLIAAATLLAGCASVTPAQQEELNRTRPTCDAGPDCNAKWDAAQLWIVHHAGFKLQTNTNVILQTYGPSQATERSTSIAVTVTREPAGPHRFVLVAHMSCGNPFGCTPELVPSLLDFNRAVSAATANE